MALTSVCVSLSGRHHSHKKQQDAYSRFFCQLLIKKRLGRGEEKIRSGICLGAVVRKVVVAFLGVHNVTALGNLITWQKVDYDFSYHQMEFPCNINVLITSEGRSLLPVWHRLPELREELELVAPSLQHAVPETSLETWGGYDTGLGDHRQAKSLFTGKPRG